MFQYDNEQMHIKLLSKLASALVNGISVSLRHSNGRFLLRFASSSGVVGLFASQPDNWCDTSLGKGAGTLYLVSVKRSRSTF